MEVRRERVEEKAAKEKLEEEEEEEDEGFQTYDVPRPKSVTTKPRPLLARLPSQNLDSSSSFSSDDSAVSLSFTPVPSLLSPAPCTATTPTGPAPPLPASKPKVVRRLFSKDEVDSPAPAPHAQFSSKTLKPKKRKESREEPGRAASQAGFRPRNKSDCSKKSESVQNELAVILERRRQALTRPDLSDRPAHLGLESTDSCPPYR